MSIDFSTLQGLTIPEGVVTQIADASGNVLWAVSGGKVILEVEKITSNTYAAETTYENEQFILLDIYPKTNGTVKVTYGGLTKTITDTSGAAEPNAQQVFFGTFNGVSDSMATPASGELTIEGDYYAFGEASFVADSKSTVGHSNCVTNIVNLGFPTKIPDYAFGHNLNFAQQNATTKLIIPETVTSIGTYGFNSFKKVENVIIPQSVRSIGGHAFGNWFALKTVTMLSPTPPTLGGDNNFDYGEQYALTEIIVPKGSGAAYKAAEYWSSKADYIVEVL